MGRKDEGREDRFIKVDRSKYGQSVFGTDDKEGQSSLRSGFDGAYTQPEIREALEFIEKQPEPRKSLLSKIMRKNGEGAEERAYEAKKSKLTPDVATLVALGI